VEHSGAAGFDAAVIAIDGLIDADVGVLKA